MTVTRRNKTYKKTDFYVARGFGRFPLDMLRRDVAFVSPEAYAIAANDEDYLADDEQSKAGVIVAFVTYAVRGEGTYRGEPTLGRWSSFGFRLTPLAAELYSVYETPKLNSWLTHRDNKPMTLEDFLKP